MSNANESLAVVPDQKKAYSTILDFLMAKKSNIANIAPKYLDSERMVRLALGAASRNPKLLMCTPRSWLLALMDCAYYGLEPNPILGHAYLIPYKNNKAKGQLEVTFLAGYKGLILLATETAGFDDVEARLVYTAELESGRFEERPEDPERPFHHRPLYEADVREEKLIAGAYAVGWRGPGKRPRFRFLTRDEIEGYRTRSRAKEDGPWTTDYGAMCQKTAVKRMLALAGLRPGSKVGTALEQEESMDRGDLVRAVQVDEDDPRLQPSRTDELAATLQKKVAGTDRARKLDDEPAPAPVEEKPPDFE